MKYLCFALFLLLMTSPSVAQSGFRNTTPDVAKGDKLFVQEKYKEALSEYRRLPVTVESLKRIGATKIKLWDMSAAIVALRDAVKRAPRDSEAKALLAEALGWDGKLGEAAALYREALEAGDAGPSVRVGYARTLSWMKDVDGALEQYRQATREFPDYLDAHMGFAEMLSWKKQFEQSATAYRRVISLTSVPAYKAVALARIGKVLTWKGDMAGAEGSYRDALRHDAKNIDAMFGLGELLEWKGKYPDAKRWYQKILQVQPGHKGAKAKLLQLMWVK
jgi:tetratricopeptide (TPR) repeat protein